jgi:hypothetical protein
LYAVIPVVRGSCWIVKYENESRDPQFIARALDELELAAEQHSRWGYGWASASVVNMLDLAVFRLTQIDDLAPDVKNRIALLWDEARDITRREADIRLVWNYPVAPFDSSTRGDTQAEEFAWEASLLGAAAAFLPEHPNAPWWEREARQYAYNAITRPSDAPDFEGIKTTTVTEDFGLENHDIEKNPFYTAATLMLLQQAELPYRMTGRAKPAELDHNFHELYRVYKSYVGRADGGALVWNRHSDPGDPSLFPLAKAGDAELDFAVVKQKAHAEKLWLDSVYSGVIPESELYAAVQNHKVAWYHLVGLYYWHWPQAR